MKNRLIKNYVTTGIGILLILGAGYVAMFQNDLERAGFLSGIGLMFLRTKDSLIGLQAK